MARPRSKKSPEPASPEAPAADFVIAPPIEPMLAKASSTIPTGDGWLFEPKWDGFRAIVFREGDSLFIQSRELRPLDRYFPELRAPLLAALPQRCVVDGEIVIATGAALEFETLQLRLHPAATRVAKLAAENPASFIAFDLLANEEGDLRERPQHERRALLERALGAAQPPIHLTPMTRDQATAESWFRRFEGAGLDGVMCKPVDGTYQPGKRAMIKVKHERTADCVVAGFRWHKQGPDTHVGSLLLGLYDATDELQHVGVTSTFTMAARQQLAAELAPLRVDAMAQHPWRAWAEAMDGAQRMPGGQSRWSAGKDLSWEPLRIERVCEVKYDHLQGARFRHGTTFLRWRADKSPSQCRYDQLEVTAPYELQQIFGVERRPR